MIYHCRPEQEDPIKTALRAAAAGDTIYLHAGTYTERISTYDVTIQGGTSWSNKLLISAYRKNNVYDKVKLISTDIISGDNRCVTLASEAASYIEFRGIEFDGRRTYDVTSLDVIKLTYSGTDPTNSSHHIRFRDCNIHDGLRQGILISGQSDFNEFLHCRIHNNGRVGTNLDHGIYISTSYNIIRDCDVYQNSAYGIHIYTGSPSVQASHNLIDGCRIGPHGSRSGILLGSGPNNVVFRNSCFQNQYGVLVDTDSLNAKILENTFEGNRDGQYGIRPGAVGTIINDNWPIE